MDYIPVYADEQDEPGTVKVGLDKIQRSGVRTEKVGSQTLARTVRAVGMIEHDETLLTIVTIRSEGYIEDLFVEKTGQHVEKGEPLFRVYSPQIQQAQTDLIIATRAEGRKGADANEALEGAMQRLRNLGVPQSRIDEIRKTQTNPRTLDWPSPVTGDVIEKNIIDGQRVMAGDELYRIADHSHVWVIADVAEADIAMIKVGMTATVSLRALQTQPIEGKVTFIYPVLKPETRTVSVRIELPNPDELMKPAMYADVVFHLGGDQAVAAVPDSAVIDSGSKQIVLIAKGDGRFEPRAVKLGRRGEGYAEVLEGVIAGPNRAKRLSRPPRSSLTPKAICEPPCKLLARERSNDCGSHSLVGPQRFPSWYCDDLRHVGRHLCRLPGTAGRNSPTSPTCR